LTWSKHIQRKKRFPNTGHCLLTHACCQIRSNWTMTLKTKDLIQRRKRESEGQNANAQTGSFGFQDKSFQLVHFTLYDPPPSREPLSLLPNFHPAAQVMWDVGRMEGVGASMASTISIISTPIISISIKFIMPIPISIIISSIFILHTQVMWAG